MISLMLLVWPRCAGWEYAEAQHRSTTTSPIVDFSLAVSSGYCGSTGRPPADGVRGAAWKDFGTSSWQLIERLHIVLWVRNSRGRRSCDRRELGVRQTAFASLSPTPFDCR